LKHKMQIFGYCAECWKEIQKERIHADKTG
jgi:hypothetical protein